MPDENKKRWIVLINRSPKGPLATDEVKLLLAQHILRHNDLAYEVSPTDPKNHSEWKLLWQFPEFDRRLEEGPVEPTPAPKPERRAEPKKEEVINQVKESIPEELLNISPEELIPRSTTIQFHSELGTPSDGSDYMPPPQDGFSESGGRSKWVYASVVLVIFGFITLRFLGRGLMEETKPEQPQVLAEEMKAEPASSSSPPTNPSRSGRSVSSRVRGLSSEMKGKLKSLPRNSHSADLPSSREIAPMDMKDEETPDAGEIPYDTEAESSADTEESRTTASAADEESDEDTRPKKKKKKSKGAKRGIQAAEEEDEGGAQNESPAESEETPSEESED